MEWHDAFRALPENSGYYFVCIECPYMQAVEPSIDWGDVCRAHYSKEDCLWITDDDTAYCAAIDRVDTSKTSYVSYWADVPGRPQAAR